MIFEDVVEAQPWLRPFPDAADVFADPVDRYARLLSPLVSIDLSAVNPDWHGWAHLISPIEPQEGYLGTGTERHHSYYARTNWLGFRLDDHDRYHLLGDWRFFLAENLVNGEPVLDPDEDPHIRQHQGDDGLADYYQTQHDSYVAAKGSFAQRGKLVNRIGVVNNLLDMVGGDESVQYDSSSSFMGNWFDPSMFDFELCDVGNGATVAYPLTDRGDRFRFVAGVPGWHYRDDGADWILMFYEPGSRTVLFTYDWS
ncbi:MAG: hypothetical protein FWD11_09375 [Micrococcales bacterium]|nr:hypothetical protein [Micrococcales bacterium]